VFPDFNGDVYSCGGFNGGVEHVEAGGAAGGVECYDVEDDGFFFTEIGDFDVVEGAHIGDGDGHPGDLPLIVVVNHMGDGLKVGFGGSIGQIASWCEDESPVSAGIDATDGVEHGVGGFAEEEDGGELKVSAGGFSVFSRERAEQFEGDVFVHGDIITGGVAHDFEVAGGIAADEEGGKAAVEFDERKQVI